ncbi:unnamed protein product [Coccothraustes coccothraustes]
MPRYPGPAAGTCGTARRGEGRWPHRDTEPMRLGGHGSARHGSFRWARVGAFPAGRYSIDEELFTVPVIFG